MIYDFKNLTTEKVLIYRVIARCDCDSDLSVKETFCSNLDVAKNVLAEYFEIGESNVSIEVVECYTKF